MLLQVFLHPVREVAHNPQRYGYGRCGTIRVAAQDILHIAPYQFSVSPRNHDREQTLSPVCKTCAPLFLAVLGLPDDYPEDLEIPVAQNFLILQNQS